MESEPEYFSVPTPEKTPEEEEEEILFPSFLYGEELPAEENIEGVEEETRKLDIATEYPKLEKEYDIRTEYPSLEVPSEVSSEGIKKDPPPSFASETTPKTLKKSSKGKAGSSRSGGDFDLNRLFIQEAELILKEHKNPRAEESSSIGALVSGGNFYFSRANNPSNKKYYYDATFFSKPKKAKIEKEEVPLTPKTPKKAKTERPRITTKLFKKKTAETGLKRPPFNFLLDLWTQYNQIKNGEDPRRDRLAAIELRELPYELIRDKTYYFSMRRPLGDFTDFLNKTPASRNIKGLGTFTYVNPNPPKAGPKPPPKVVKVAIKSPFDIKLKPYASYDNSIPAAINPSNAIDLFFGDHPRSYIRKETVLFGDVSVPNARNYTTKPVKITYAVHMNLANAGKPVSVYRIGMSCSRKKDVHPVDPYNLAALFAARVTTDPMVSSVLFMNKKDHEEVFIQYPRVIIRVLAVAPLQPFIESLHLVMKDEEFDIILDPTVCHDTPRGWANIGEMYKWAAGGNDFEASPENCVFSISSVSKARERKEEEMNTIYSNRTKELTAIIKKISPTTDVDRLAQEEKLGIEFARKFSPIPQHNSDFARFKNECEREIRAAPGTFAYIKPVYEINNLANMEELKSFLEKTFAKVSPQKIASDEEILDHVEIERPDCWGVNLAFDWNGHPFALPKLPKGVQEAGQLLVAAPEGNRYKIYYGFRIFVGKRENAVRYIMHPRFFDVIFREGFPDRFQNNSPVNKDLSAEDWKRFSEYNLSGKSGTTSLQIYQEALLQYGIYGIRGMYDVSYH